MSYSRTSKTLTDLKEYLLAQEQLINKDMEKGLFANAHQRLVIALAYATKQGKLAVGQMGIEPLTQNQTGSIATLNQENNIIVQRLQPLIETCADQQNAIEIAKEREEYRAQVEAERQKAEAERLKAEAAADAERLRAAAAAEAQRMQNAIAQEYTNNINQLAALTAQRKPTESVNIKLSLVIQKIEELHDEGKIPAAKLNQIMQATYNRLIGGQADAFYTVMSELQTAKHSIPLKGLGALLLALDIALVASAVFFAPAVITASVSLATIYGATAAVAAASVALPMIAHGLFKTQTDRMALKDMSNDLNDELENTDYYRAVAMV